MRRALVRIVVAIASLAPPAVAANGVREWRFDATADGIPIGTHVYVMRHGEGARSVESDMRFGVRLLIVDAYRFEHHASETWRGDCLSTLDTRTDERGGVTTVSGRARPGAFDVDGADGRTSLPECVMTFAYWNPRVLRQSHLLNGQTGAWTPVTIDALGADTIDVRGRPRVANRFRLTTEKNRIEVWYAQDDGEWVAMRTTTREGHVLSYRLK